MAFDSNQTDNGISEENNTEVTQDPSKHKSASQKRFWGRTLKRYSVGIISK